MPNFTRQTPHAPTTHMTHSATDVRLTEPVGTRALPARRSTTIITAETALRASAALWFAVAVIGQWTFVSYILGFYASSASRGAWSEWKKILTHGIVPGDTMGNAALVAHIFLAVIITVGGPLQLVPALRARAPSFHRWNGRVYLTTAFASGISGLYMIWVGGIGGSLAQRVGISVDALLIMTFAVVAVRYALARNMRLHRRWALRLFMVVSASWFFRVGLMFWIAVNHGPAGFDPKTFRGPFIDVLSFAQYLVPLAVLEIYLRTRDRAGSPRRYAMAGSLLVLTAAMGLGIVVATKVMWLPRM